MSKTFSTNAALIIATKVSALGSIGLALTLRTRSGEAQLNPFACVQSLELSKEYREQSKIQIATRRRSFRMARVDRCLRPAGPRITESDSHSPDSAASHTPIQRKVPSSPRKPHTARALAPGLRLRFRNRVDFAPEFGGHLQPPNVTVLLGQIVRSWRWGHLRNMDSAATLLLAMCMGRGWTAL
jgi:hypothetical protein